MAHTHDGIDWTSRLVPMRRGDLIEAEVNSFVADRLVDPLPAGATVVDVGSGSGGMAAAFAAALSVRGGGRIVLVDAVPELLEAAASAAGGAAGVEVVSVVADASDESLGDVVPAADLVWASGVMHHLPDERRGVAGLVRILRSGGWLAVGEGGLSTRCLPWDVGVGEPGLQDRVIAAQTAWFASMRSGIDGAVRMPFGWNRALGLAGLLDVSAFSYLIDLPAPAAQPVRDSVADWLRWVSHVAEDRLSLSDRDAVSRLLDESGAEFVGGRDDVFVLSAHTVHYGRAS